MAEDRVVIVVGIDGSLVAQEALRWAARLATRLQGELVVVHALGLLEVLHGDLVPAHRHLAGIEDVAAREWCAPLARSRIPHRIVVREGHPLDVLTAVAVEESAGLLVVGSRGLVRAVEELPMFPLGPAARATSEGEWDAPQRERLQAEPFCAAVRQHRLPVHLVVERGAADEVVRAVATRVDADLVVTA